MDNGTAFTDKPGWQEMQFIEETDGRDPRLAQSIRTPGYTRIGQTKVEGPMFDVTVTGYQPSSSYRTPRPTATTTTVWTLRTAICPSTASAKCC